MIDLPAQEPATVEVQKMDQKQNLIHKIRSMCEATKDIREEITVDLIDKPAIIFCSIIEPI